MFTTGIGGTSPFSAAILTATAAVNTAPKLSLAGPTLPAINANATRGREGEGWEGRGGHGVGTWQYLLPGGIWLALPATVSASSALLLPSTAWLRFVSDDQPGTATLSYLGWDQTQGKAGAMFDIANQGQATAFSTASAAAAITVR